MTGERTDPAGLDMRGSALPPGAQLRCPRCDGAGFTVHVNSEDSLVVRCLNAACAALAPALTCDEWAPREERP